MSVLYAYFYFSNLNWLLSERETAIWLQKKHNPALCSMIYPQIFLLFPPINGFYYLFLLVILLKLLSLLQKLIYPCCNLLFSYFYAVILFIFFAFLRLLLNTEHGSIREFFLNSYVKYLCEKIIFNNINIKKSFLKSANVP